ncbi:MAG TPA: holo-ACP synthase [Phycisphaerales bacterium]|nr:holo-ACP synthase [Phycisphaerales bacterium]
MNALAHGIDLVEVARIARMLEEHGERFEKRCFTGGELAYARASRRVHEHLAARFAAKEAVLKALGTGLRGGIEWTDIEVEHAAGGAPAIRLHGEAAKIAAGLGIRRWLVSLSHTDKLAIASVIAVGDGRSMSDGSNEPRA